MDLGKTGEPDRIGPYRVAGRLGRGGMGVVYEVHREGKDTPLALKMVEIRFLVRDDTQARRRFEHEIRVLSRLRHTGIVRIHDAGVAAHPQGYEVLFMVTERLSGSSLEETLKADHVVPPEQALRLTRDLADALNYLHEQGVEHRDIKPSNIFLTEEGRTVLIDFGLATRRDMTRLTQAGQVIGSQSYMAPERLTGRETGIRSDVFALGVVLYRMLTGKFPFAADNLTDLAVKMVHGLDDAQKEAIASPKLRALVERMLAPDPKARPLPPELVGELDGLLGGFAPTAAHEVQVRPFDGLPRPTVGTVGGGPVEVIASGTDASHSAPVPLVTGRPVARPGVEGSYSFRTLVGAAGMTFLTGLAIGIWGTQIAQVGQPPVVAMPPPPVVVPIAEAPEKAESPAPKAVVVRSLTPKEPPPPAPPPAESDAVPELSSAEAAYSYGQFALLEGHYTRAVLALRQAIKLNPVMAEAHRGLGDAHRALQENGEAEEAYRMYLILRPSAEADDVRQWLSNLDAARAPAP